MMKRENEIFVHIRRDDPETAWTAGVFHILWIDDTGNLRNAGAGVLISGSGIIATVSHVPFEMDRKFGVKQFGLHFHAGGLRIKAMVLDKGRDGLDDELLEGVALLDLEHMPLAAFGRDIAFLQLLPGTAAFLDDSGDRSDKGDPVAVLQERARVLPLGRPAYRSPRRLRSYCMRYNNNDPDPQDVSSTFGALNANFQQVQLTSDDLRPGDSGSGLWDPDRRVIVGLVRRGIHDRKKLVMAVDAEAVADALTEVVPDYRMSWDLQGGLYMERFGGSIRKLAAERHASLLRRAETPAFIEPLLRSLIAPSPKQIWPDPKRADEIIFDLARRRQSALLLGPAGVGKSTLALQFCTRIVDASEELGIADLQIIPILVHATDLARREGALAERLFAVARQRGWIDGSVESFDEFTENNGARWIVFVDGLDELDGRRRTPLIKCLLPECQRPSDWLQCLILTSRPIHQTKGKWIVEVFVPFEVLPFSPDQKDAYLLAVFGDQAPVVEEKLKPHALTKGTINPLILAVATNVFQETGDLPSRPASLFSEFVKLQLDRARTELEEEKRVAQKKGLTTYDDRLYEGLVDIVNVIALTELEVRDSVSVDTFLNRMDELPGQLRPLKSSWLMSQEQELRRFIRDEVAGKVGFLYLEDGHVQWIHRTIQEVCAASALIDHAGGVGSKVLDEYFERFRKDDWHTFLVHLSALLIEKGDEGYDRVQRDLVTACMARVHIAPRNILLPIRLIAAGVGMKQKLRDDAFSIFFRRLAAGQLEMNRCAEALFSSNDLMGVLALAGLESIRGPLIEIAMSRIEPMGQSRRMRGYAREINVLKKIEASDELRILADGESVYGEHVATNARGALEEEGQAGNGEDVRPASQRPRRKPRSARRIPVIWSVRTDMGDSSAQEVYVDLDDFVDTFQGQTSHLRSRDRSKPGGSDKKRGA